MFLSAVEKSSKLEESTFSPIALKKLLTLSIAFPKRPTIVSTALPNRLVSFIDSAILPIQSPSDPVMLKSPPLRPIILPTNWVTPLTIALTTVTPILRIENKPLKVDCILSALSLVKCLNATVRCQIFSVISISCFDVIGGNTSRNASLTGLIIFIKPSNALLIASIAAARPSFSAHSPITLFRASAD